MRSRHFAIILLAVTLLAAACSKSAQQYFESGNEYFAQKKFNEAVVEYRNAVQKDPRHGEARYRLAQAYDELRDPAKALQEYVRAADLLPQNKDAQLAAGKRLLAVNQFEDAKARAEKVLALDPKSVDGQVLLGLALSNLKQVDAAITQLQEAAALDPSASATYTSLGAVQMQKGDPQAAEQAFKKAVENDPRSVDALLALGGFYVFQNRTGDAEAALKQAVQLDPGGEWANRVLAGFYMNANRAAEAEAPLKALAAARNDVASNLTLADYYLTTRRTAEAMPLLERIASQPGGFAAAKERIAGLQYSAGKTADAHTTIDEVLAKEPNNPQALLVKARFLQHERKDDEALAKVRAAVAVDARSVRGYYMLGTLLAQKNQVDEARKAFSEVLKLNPRAAAAQIQLSRLELLEGKGAPAVEYAEQAVAAEPGNPVARVTLVRSLLARRDTTRAEIELKALLSQYPKAPQVHALAGSLALQKKDPAGARKAFQAAFDLDPNSTEALAGLVTLDVAAQKLPEARARVDARLTRTPKDPAALLLAAHTYAAVGDVPKAEATLLNAIQVAPENLQAYASLGRLYIAQQKLDEARQKFEELSARQPQPVGPQTMVGMLLQMQGRHEEAQKKYEHVLELDPRAPVAANNLAWMYADSGRNLELAQQLAQTAKAAMPDVPEVNDTLGWVYYKRDRPREAAASFREALSRAPNNASYHYHLGLALSKGGDGAGAKSAFEKALSVDPNFPQAAEARKALGTL